MSNRDHLNTSSRPIGEADRERLRALVQSLGERSLLERAQFSRATLYRSLAGLPLYAGTHALLRDLLRPDGV